MSWISPDNKIHKIVIEEGIWGKKPSEQCKCRILVSDCADSNLEYNNTSVVIGDSDDYFSRLLDLCLPTMNEQETAKFIIIPKNVTFTVKLVSVEFNGYIDEWDAEKKFQIARDIKEKGVTLYKQNRFKDAAYKFTKALKILNSVPINVEHTPEIIDNIPLSDIYKLKSNLYSNLGTYYLDMKAWPLTIEACQRALENDNNNVKAHYKLGVAFIKDRNFEEAQKEFNFVLSVEPNNRTAIEFLRDIQHELQLAEVRVRSMVKKMFVVP